MWFVDYLRYISENADDEDQYVDFLQSHKRLCEKQLAEARSIDGRSREGRSRRSKAAWLQRYHNSHVSAVDGIWLASVAGIKPKDTDRIEVLLPRSLNAVFWRQAQAADIGGLSCLLSAPAGAAGMNPSETACCASFNYPADAGFRDPIRLRQVLQAHSCCTIT